MLKINNMLVRGLRRRLLTEPYLTLVAFLLLACLAVPYGTYASNLENVYVDRYDLDVVEKDILAVYIKPVFDYVSAECGALDRGNPLDLSVSTNYTDTLFGKTTAIWFQPQAQGNYNLTITFQTNEVWNYTIGVYARNIGFYGKNVRIYGYNFIELFGPHTRLSGNWTINIKLNSRSRSSPIFFIELPTPVNSILLVTAAGLITYFNVFLLLDTYFKNKKEMVSNKRWFLIGAAIIISIFVIYQLYTFTTFILPGGV